MLACEFKLIVSTKQITNTYINILYPTRYRFTYDMFSNVKETFTNTKWI